MKPHLHWKIITADKGLDNKIKNVTEVQVTAETEDEAKKKAKDMIKRAEYQVTHVAECFQPDIPEAMEEAERRLAKTMRDADKN